MDRCVAALAALLLAGCSPVARDAATPAPGAVGAPPAPPQQPAPSPAEVYRERLQTHLTPYLDAMGKRWGEAFAFSGLVHVTVGGQKIYSEARGFRDRSARAPINADTSFRVGSVTKQFTAAAILELAERGELSVTDTVRKHLPDYPKSGDEVTIHHLLTHTAGIPSDDFMRQVVESADQVRSVAELLAMFQRAPLDFQPGAEFKYSNAGYVLLGAIIEKVSGSRYGELIDRALFRPAGLEATTYGDDRDRKNRAIGYTVDASESVVAAEPIDMSNPLSAGGVRSTARDLVKWDRALRGGRVLERATRRAMYTPALRDYAYGWRVTRRDGKQVLEHSGGINGFNCIYVRIPADDLVIVAWTNNDSRRIRPVADAALAAMAGEPVSPPVEPKPAPIEPVNARRITGGYVLTAESRGALAAIGLPAPLIESLGAAFIRREGAVVYFDAIGQDPVRIHARPADSDGFQTDFFAKTSALKLSFSYAIDDQGQRQAAAATTLTVSQRGIEVKLARDRRGATRLRDAWKRKHRTTKKKPRRPRRR